MEPSPAASLRWEKIQAKNQDVSLKWRLRKNHTITHYKNSIIFFGGQPLTPPHLLINPLIQQNSGQDPPEINQEINFHSNIHKIDLSTRQWQEIPLINTAVSSNTAGSSLGFISEHSSVILNNFIYFFGGINYKTKSLRPPQLWTINLDSLIVKKVDAKGSIPTARSKVALVILNKYFLLLFGGRDESQFLNDIFLFKLETKNWMKAEQSYQYSVPKIINPCISVLGDGHFYLYGGEREIAYDTEIQKVPNYDFYKFKVITKTVTSHPDTDVKKVIHNLPPIPAISGQLLNYLDKYLVLLNHDTNKNRLESVWVYKPEDILWTQLKRNEEEIQNPIKSNSNFISIGQRIYSCNTNIYELTLDSYALQKETLSTRYNTEIERCPLCTSENYHYLVPKRVLKSQINSYLEPLSFAFAAIGLLVDNCELLKVNMCNIYFTSNTAANAEKCIIIQDNGMVSDLWGVEINDFTETMECFYGGCLDTEMVYKENLSQIQSLFEKQTKTKVSANKSEKDIQKQRMEVEQKKRHLQHKKNKIQIKMRQQKYATNWKLGGMRLGNLVIYACKEQQKDENQGCFIDVRRYAIIHLQTASESQNEMEEEDSQQEYYAFYCYMTHDGVCVNSSMEAKMKMMQKKYKKELKVVSEKLKAMNNVVYISNLKKEMNIDPQKPESSNSTEFYFRKKLNDVYLGPQHVINAVDSKPSVNISDFCDISLKTYLSLLYISSHITYLNLSVKDNQLETIHPQKYLNSIDKLCKSKKIVSTDECLDLEVKTMQIYHSNQIFEQEIIKSQYSFMNNGVLIYVDDRLISRFKINLGEMVDEKNIERINKSKLFGFIGLYQFFDANIFKTDVLYPAALEPYFARLNFVEQFFEKHKNSLKNSKRYRKEDPKVGSQPIKKIKID